MAERELDEFRNLKFVPSRIPALDGLVAFVPTGHEQDAAVTELTARASQSRWYPVEGGHRVVVPYEGGAYDVSFCTLEPGAWDHEHCMHCGQTIEPRTLCWVTADTP